jgi:hypothetical protein
MINKAAFCGRTQIIAVHTDEFAQGIGALLVLKLDCIIELPPPVVKVQF